MEHYQHFCAHLPNAKLEYAKISDLRFLCGHLIISTLDDIKKMMLKSGNRPLTLGITITSFTLSYPLWKVVTLLRTKRLS